MKLKQQRKKFYHASPRRFKKGEIIDIKGVNFGTKLPGVFLTNSEVPHYTICERMDATYHVYEVRPIGKVRIATLWDEYTAESAEVVRYVGVAQGIMNRRKKRFKTKSGLPGSGVNKRRYLQPGTSSWEKHLLSGN